MFFGLFLFTFGLSFFQMFPSGEEFPETLEMMVLKMYTMLLGEIDLMDIPFIKTPGWKRFFEFILVAAFLVLMVLVLQNLLNALAINNINDMMKVEEQKISKISSLLELSRYWERSPGIKRHIGIGSQVLKPFGYDVKMNGSHRTVFKIFFPIFNTIFDSEEICVGLDENDISDVEPIWTKRLLAYHGYIKLIQFYFYDFFKASYFTINKEVANAAKEIIDLKEEQQNKSSKVCSHLMTSLQGRGPDLCDLTHFQTLVKPSKI